MIKVNRLVGEHMYNFAIDYSKDETGYTSIQALNIKRAFEKLGHKRKYIRITVSRQPLKLILCRMCGTKIYNMTFNGNFTMTFSGKDSRVLSAISGNINDKENLIVKRRIVK